jgi:hypothetical protein
MDMTKVLEPVPWHRSFDVVEACRRDERIDELCVRILGGVPSGRRARVVELPVRVEPVLEAAA